jgi:hypothetical protein
MNTILSQLNHTPSVSSKVVQITPEMARTLIANTEGRLQRAPHRSTIAEYSSAMKRGEWTLNYQPIQIGIDGNVLDGQHRLKACIESNVPFQTLIIENVPEVVFDSMDRGRSRTLGDILSARSIENYNSVAATISVLHTINLNLYSLSASSKGSTSLSGDKRKYRVSPSQMDKFLEKNPDFISFVADGLRLHAVGSKLLTQSVFIALWYYCAKHSKGNANTFFSKLSTGASINEDSPIFFIRKKLLAFKSKEDFIKSADIINLILKGFDMYCNNETVKSYIQIPKEMYKLKTQMNMF